MNASVHLEPQSQDLVFKGEDDISVFHSWIARQGLTPLEVLQLRCIDGDDGLRGMTPKDLHEAGRGLQKAPYPLKGAQSCCDRLELGRRNQMG